MALTQPRSLFGIHSVTFLNKETFEPYGIAKVLGGSTLELTGEQETLFGGSNKYAWDVENKTISTSFTINIKEYSDMMFERMLGATAVETSAEVSGSVDTLTNVYGTLLEASTGIASVGLEAGETDNLKFGKYLVKAVSATTVDVYAFSDVDFAKGTDLSYQDDTLKITASALTIATGATVSIPNLGVELTGGSGTIALNTGDTAIFEILPPHSGTSRIAVGSANSVFSEFACIVLAQKKSTGDMFQITIYRATGIGMPLPLAEGGFAVSDLTVSALFDSSRDKVFDITACKASS